MDFSDVKRYCKQTVAAFDPRTLKEEFEFSNAVLSSVMSNSRFDPYFRLKTHEKIAIILKPHFKLVTYMAIVATIVFASIPLSHLAVTAGIGIAISAIFTLAATYVENPNYFKASWVKRQWDKLNDLINL